jgi:hypothetical protein
MALPIAHATVGYVVHRLDGRRTRFVGWPRALTYMAIANLPDVDFLVGFVVGAPGVYHRGFSHTLVAALVFGAAAGTVSWGVLRERWWPAAVAFAAAYGSHLLVDAFTVDARPPTGAPFFWPFSDAYYLAPVTIFHEILIDGRSRLGFVDSVVGWPTAMVLAREIVIAAAIVLTIEAVGSVRRHWVQRASGAAMLAAETQEEDLV